MGRLPEIQKKKISKKSKFASLKRKAPYALQGKNLEVVSPRMGEERASGGGEVLFRWLSGEKSHGGVR